MEKYKEHDIVNLNIDLPNIEKGTSGTLVFVHEGLKAYLIELKDLDEQIMVVPIIEAELVSDKEIFDFYMKGWHDELDGKGQTVFEKEVFSIAYEYGRSDALIGDEVSSNDLQTKEEILDKIKNFWKNKKDGLE